MTGFDAAAWVDKAIAARMRPLVVIEPDGKRALSCCCIDTITELQPMAPQSDDDVRAVMDVLVSMGAVVKAPPLPEGLRRVSGGTS